MQERKMAGKEASVGTETERVSKVSKPECSGPKKPSSKASASKLPKTSKGSIVAKARKALSKSTSSTSPKKAPVTRKPVKVLGAKKKPAKKKPVVRRAPRKPVLPPIDIKGHSLVPKHEKLSDTEKQELLTRLQVTIKGMPRISPADPVIKHLEPKLGDIIKITRNSYTAGIAVYYRVVVHV